MLDTILIIVLSIGLMGAIFLAAYFVVKARPLTCALFVIQDKTQPLIHILGYESVMPDDGDSFEIYKHFTFHRYTKKFELLAKQRGTGLDLESNFVKRSLDAYYEKNKVRLEFGKAAEKDAFTFLSEPAEGDPVFEIYQIHHSTSDTQVASEIKPDALLFTRYFDHGFGKFTLTVQRNGKQLATHHLEGNPEFYLMGFCDNRTKTLIFTYGKQKYLKVGMGLCVINYLSGAMEFEAFVR